MISKNFTYVIRTLLCFVIFLTGINTDSYSSEIYNCQLTGKVSDSITGEGLPFASVQITSTADSSFSTGSITDINGVFTISEIPPGKYILLASFMGYIQENIHLELADRNNSINITLSKKNYTISEVNIYAEKSLKEEGIEKTTVNISKDNTLSGGNAIEVMQTLPSVDFDINGNIQYRGSDKVTILLNGRKSELVKTLDQIPSDQIEKIEIINNPSAKYEADGMSGIINIVLKSGNKTKNKTALMLYAGLPETFGGNAGYSGFSGKSTFFVNGSYNHKTRFQTKEHLRKNYESPTIPDYYQYDRQDEILNDVLINTGFNYSINSKQQLGLSLLGSRKFNAADRSIDYRTLNDKGELLYQSLKNIDINLNNYSIDGNLNYQYNLTENGQKLEANFHYSLLDQLQEMDNVYYPEETSNETELQNTDSKQLNKEAVFSLDYIMPINDSLLFESGYQFSNKDLLNDFSSTSYDPIINEWISDTSLNNRFHYLQYINALYINLKATFKYFDLQAGLRGEYTLNKQLGNQKDDYINLFPSMTLSKQITKHADVFISYNRRINRPTIKMLNPYTNEYADILNMHVGNPNLKPEYVNSVEAGTHYFFEKISGSGSMYYRHITHAISRVKSATNDSALVVTFMNLNNANLYGGEVSISFDLFKWWHINTGCNVFYTTLSGIYGPNIIERSHFAYTANIQNKIQLPAGIGLQLSGYYRSKLPDVMGTYMERYYMDLAINKKILKNKGKLIFKISDVFNTYRYGLDLTGIDENGHEYSQSNRRKNESQYFILSFVYNIDGKEKKKKKENFFLEGFGK